MADGATGTAAAAQAAAARAAALAAGTAVVTGAGGGLGRALAVALAAEGMLVAGLGRRAAALAGTAALIAPGRFLALAADVADPAAVAAAFARLDAAAPPVTVLVNNAAVHDRFDLLAPDGAARLMDSVAINLGGVAHCCHAALARMIRTGFGRIVNVATFADLAPLPGAGAYSVSKGAARIFTRALVADIADRFPDIVVTDWVPGALATGMGIPEGLDPAVAARWGAALALMHDRSLTGALFDRDREVLAPRPLRRRLRDALLLRTPPPPRRIGDPAPGPAPGRTRQSGA